MHFYTRYFKFVHEAIVIMTFAPFIRLDVKINTNYYFLKSVHRIIGISRITGHTPSKIKLLSNTGTQPCNQALNE